MGLKLPAQSHKACSFHKSYSQHTSHESANDEEREVFHEGGKQGECGGKKQREYDDDPSALCVAEKAPQITRNHNALERERDESQKWNVSQV
jgi:hypothetical protein